MCWMWKKLLWFSYADSQNAEQITGSYRRQYNLRDLQIIQGRLDRIGNSLVNIVKSWWIACTLNETI